MSPIAFHFTSALFVSAAALVPSHTRLTLGVLVALNAVGGDRLLAVRAAPAPDRRHLRPRRQALLRHHPARRLCGRTCGRMADLRRIVARAGIPRRHGRAAARRQHPQRLGPDAVARRAAASRKKRRRAPRASCLRADGEAASIPGQRLRLGEIKILPRFRPVLQRADVVHELRRACRPCAGSCRHSAPGAVRMA